MSKVATTRKPFQKAIDFTQNDVGEWIMPEYVWTLPTPDFEYMGLVRDKSKLAIHNGSKPWAAKYGADHTFIPTTRAALLGPHEIDF